MKVLFDPTLISRNFFYLLLISFCHLGIPNVYDDDLSKEAVIQWLEELQIGPHIAKVTPAMLKTMTEEEVKKKDFEYFHSFFNFFYYI